MIDELFFKGKYNIHPINYVMFSGIITVLAIISGIFLFGANSSVAQLLLVTILHVPVLQKLFAAEEKILRKEGLHNFFHNHWRVFELFTLIFIGMTIGYLFIQLFTVHDPGFFSSAFSYQIEFIQSQEGTPTLFPSIFSGEGLMTAMFNNFVALILISFLLSFLYGAGSLFLMVFTASVLSTLMIFLARTTESFPTYGGLLSIIFTLVLTPLMMSSVAGGVVSRAVVIEKLWSARFRNVVKDASFLLLVSVILSVLFSGFRIWIFQAIV